MASLFFPRDRRAAAAALAITFFLVVDREPPRSQAQGAGTYTIYSTEGRRTIAVRTSGPRDQLVVTLNQLVGFFGLKLTEDRTSGGLLIETRDQRIIAVPGQSFANVAGKVISLDGAIERDGNNWVAPFDFVPKVLGPALGQSVVIRRPSRIILVGDVRVPQITGRVERLASGGRVTIDVDPAAPRKVTREGNRLVIRFDAAALDATPIQGNVPDFIVGVRIEGTSVVVGVGPGAALVQTSDEKDLAHITVELLPPPPPPPPTPKPVPVPTPPVTPPPGQPQPDPQAKPDTPVIDLAPGAIRTVVIDPGHGGTDNGVKGPAGSLEKDITLDVARRLKGAIESRLGLRVLLTRDTDRDVAIDERSALANNNKADLFVSLHANASVRPGLRGVQVLTLDPQDYPALGADLKKFAVPVIGGGTRTVAAVPWNLAQVPFAARSAAFGVVLTGHLHERSVPLHPKATDLAPMRVLASANMAAVLIELGFLTNPEDEAALSNGTLGASVIEAIIVAISDARRGVPGPEPGRNDR
jgi:N-acetylmuramoyl-L-alanine amidase